jgi:hypothetical protein
MRRALLEGDDIFRRQVLWRLDRWTQDSEERWTRTVASNFLTTVWPRQLEANSAAVSVQMCEVLFGLGDLFPSTADAVLPRMTPIASDSSTGREWIGEPEQHLLEQHPEAVLSVLGQDASR